MTGWRGATERGATWLVTRPWLPGNAQHAVNVETMRALVTIMESLARIETQLGIAPLDSKRADHLGSALG